MPGIPTISSKSGRSRSIILLVVFASGFSALVYQIIWLRSLNLVFGIHVFSTSTVLAAFMAGLALGSLVFGSIADRTPRLLQLLMLIELGIAVFAMLFPSLSAIVTDIFLKTDHPYLQTPTGTPFIKFMLAFTLLLIPTTLMGGTIPVVSKLLIRKLASSGSRLSLIYALNNLGAALGGLLTGFIFISEFGTKGTLWLAISLNLINFLILWALSWSEDPSTMPPSPALTENLNPQLPKWFMNLILIIFTVEGFTALAYEVLWTRIMISFSFDKTIYLYSVIIVSFICGLGLGGFISKAFVDRVKNLPGLLALIIILTGLSSLMLLFVFLRASPSFSEASPSFQYILIFILILPSAILMGLTFPIVGKLAADKLAVVGRKIGLTGFLDTFGSIFGSFVAGFIFIPLLGVFRSFILLVCLNLIFGFVLIAFRPAAPKRIRPLAIPLILILLILPFLIQNDLFTNFQNKHFPNDEILSREEGISSSVAVHRLPSGHRALSINGAKTAFTTDEDLKVHTLLYMIPWLLADNQENTLVIGFGMGVTASGFAETENINVDIAEISPEVVNQASRYFRDLNKDVLEKENVNLFMEDGRSLLIRSQKNYDIISSNAVHARLGSNLYTTEFYQICKDKLNPDGIICQWLPTNWLNMNEFKSLIAAFTGIFPDARLWYVNRGHTLLTGSKNGRKINISSWENKLGESRQLDYLADMGIRSSSELLAHFWGNSSSLKQLQENTDPNSDNHPRVEFSKVENLKPNPEILLSLTRLTINPDVDFDLSGLPEPESDSFLEITEQHRTILKNNLLSAVPGLDYAN